MLSFPVSVISTVPKSNIPFAVIPVLSSPSPGSLQLNPAFDVVIKFPSPSTFSSCSL